MKVTDLHRHEFAVQSSAEYYTATAFRGRGKNECVEAKDFPSAVLEARKLYRDRPVSIYAIKGHQQSHVINLNNPDEAIKMTYLLRRKNYMDAVAVTVYADAAMAKTAAEHIKDPAITAVVVEKAGDLEGSNKLLCDLFNSLQADKDAPPVAKFSSKADGQRRLFERIEERAKGLPVLSVPVSEETAAAPRNAEVSEQQETTTQENDVAKKATKRTKKPAKASSDKKRSRVALDKHIKVLVDSNPKREGSAAHARFKLYRTGDTVAKALDKGVWPADIRWDVKQKFIALTD